MKKSVKILRTLLLNKNFRKGCTMEENFEFTKLSNEDLLELYKQVNDYIAFLEKEIKEKGTEEK